MPKEIQTAWLSEERKGGIPDGGPWHKVEKDLVWAMMVLTRVTKTTCHVISTILVFISYTIIPALKNPTLLLYFVYSYHFCCYNPYFFTFYILHLTCHANGLKGGEDRDDTWLEVIHL